MFEFRNTPKNLVSLTKSQAAPEGKFVNISEILLFFSVRNVIELVLE